VVVVSDLVGEVGDLCFQRRAAVLQETLADFPELRCMLR
jgi:hypothetical protein